MGAIVKSLVALNNAKVRIIVLLYPSTLIGTRNDDEHFVVMILLDDCERELFANATFAFVADCKNVNGVHGFRERRRALRRALAALNACGLSLRLGGFPLLCWWLGTFMLASPIEQSWQRCHRWFH